jgi:hypothetical protein
VTTVHTSALDHAIAEALHVAERVSLTVIERNKDNTPVLYQAAVCGQGHVASGKAATAVWALGAAMRKLTAAIGVDGGTAGGGAA